MDPMAPNAKIPVSGVGEEDLRLLLTVFNRLIKAAWNADDLADTKHLYARPSSDVIRRAATMVEEAYDLLTRNGASLD